MRSSTAPCWIIKTGKNTRTFREVSEVGARLEALSGLADGTVNRPEAAVIFDWENWWAVEDYTGTPAGLLIMWRGCWTTTALFWEAGIEADFVNMDADLSGI